MAAKVFKMTAAGKAELEKELEALMATFQKTANMMRQNQSRQKLKQELQSLNISLTILKSLTQATATLFPWVQKLL